MGWGDEDFEPRSKVGNEPELVRDVARFNDVLNAIAQALKHPTLSESAKRDLANKREEAKGLARSVHLQIKNPPADLDRRVHEKLEREFAQDFKRYNQLMRQAIAKDKEIVHRLSLGNKQDAGPGPEPAGMLAQQQEFSLGHAQAVTEEELIREKNAEIQALEHDLREVNELMRDVNILVGEQQAGIDSIEQNVASAQVNVEKGNQQLVKANKSQVASRKKMCCLAMLLLVIGLVLALYFGLK